MACPYFYPEREVDFSARPRPARAPLGTVFEGVCTVDGLRPPDSLLYEQCNFGYGRGPCRAFPADANVDAVRFSRVGGRLMYVLERAYSPAFHGPCEGELPAVLARQAAVAEGRL